MDGVADCGGGAGDDGGVGMKRFDNAEGTSLENRPVLRAGVFKVSWEGGGLAKGAWLLAAPTFLRSSWLSSSS